MRHFLHPYYTQQGLIEFAGNIGGIVLMRSGGAQTDPPPPALLQGEAPESAIRLATSLAQAEVGSVEIVSPTSAGPAMQVALPFFDRTGNQSGAILAYVDREEILHQTVTSFSAPEKEIAVASDGSAHLTRKSANAPPLMAPGPTDRALPMLLAGLSGEQPPQGSSIDGDMAVSRETIAFSDGAPLRHLRSAATMPSARLLRDTSSSLRNNISLALATAIASIVIAAHRAARLTRRFCVLRKETPSGAANVVPLKLTVTGDAKSAQLTCIFAQMHLSRCA
ncbi:hypothetical protein RDV64_22465 [Acuticoccus sp. MNP-M23]|uniref:hypothetical protein n=1 Tax=Acuticoccus sp. MNP-M23 TaxID=3072793 RepID=UPI00281689E1|nr:hypothetical protein [Acuticoccus sp. MNP-M23]WMS42782.1 hypothetical protein RDV64_22465 [Acuticoccus sp. MNP-M23]